MLLTNAHDDEVGELVRQRFHKDFYIQIVDITGSKHQAAMFVAVIFGYSFAEKSLHLKGIPAAKKPVYKAQLKHLLNSALSFTES